MIILLPIQRDTVFENQLNVSFYNIASEASYVYFFDYRKIIFGLFYAVKTVLSEFENIFISEVKRSILMLSINSTEYINEHQNWPFNFGNMKGFQVHLALSSLHKKGQK